MWDFNWPKILGRLRALKTEHPGLKSCSASAALCDSRSTELRFPHLENESDDASLGS